MLRARRKQILTGTNRQMTYADLFCGIGGFHLAASSHKMRCVYACDIDSEARRGYRHNFGIEPDGDISQISASAVPDCDMMFAGFPCQPFSIIGRRAGFDDMRGTIFFEAARIIAAKRPQAVVLENVRQLSTHNGGKTIARVCSQLKKSGYEVTYKVLNALDFGLPQKRERVFIVGIMDGLGDFSFPSKKTTKKSFLKDILETDVPERFFVSERIAKKRQQQHQSKYDPAIWHENKGGNVNSYPFSCALRAGASYNYLLVNGERRLTPKEMLRLQGFPESFEIICNDSNIRKQTGNAVPVPMVAAVIGEVKNELTRRASKQTDKVVPVPMAEIYSQAVEAEYRHQPESSTAKVEGRVS